MSSTARMINLPFNNWTTPDESLAGNKASPLDSEDADKIALRAHQKMAERSSFADATKAQFKYRLQPNTAPVDLDDNDFDVVLPASGAFKRNVVGKRSVNTLQEWEGYVSQVGKHSFEAVLSDLTDKSRGRETASIPIDLLPSEEKTHLRAGAVFRFIVGFAVTDRGNRINDTVIYFRRYNPMLAGDGRAVANLLRATR